MKVTDGELPPPPPPPFVPVVITLETAEEARLHYSLIQMGYHMCGRNADAGEFAKKKSFAQKLLLLLASNNSGDGRRY